MKMLGLRLIVEVTGVLFLALFTIDGIFALANMPSTLANVAAVGVLLLCVRGVSVWFDSLLRRLANGWEAADAMVVSEEETKS